LLNDVYGKLAEGNKAQNQAFAEELLNTAIGNLVRTGLTTAFSNLEFRRGGLPALISRVAGGVAIPVLSIKGFFRTSNQRGQDNH